MTEQEQPKGRTAVAATRVRDWIRADFARPIVAARNGWRSGSRWRRRRAVRRRQEALRTHTPNLWPVWLAAAVALIAASGAAYAIFLGVHKNRALVGSNPVPLDVTKVVLTIVAGVGAVLAAVYTYRKQRLAEGDSRRADADAFTARFTSASEQLGHDRAAVRLAGVYAMSRLADDWAEQRPTCVNVLCAYLRMPYDPENAPAGERTVRLTVIECIRDHLLKPDAPNSWCGISLDFTDSTFDGGDFSGATFVRARFANATFTGPVSFSDAQFQRATISFRKARFLKNYVSFRGANFERSVLMFNESQFNGGALIFDSTEMSARTRILFTGAKFNGSNVTFTEAQLTMSQLSFENASCTAGSIWFQRTMFLSKSDLTLKNATFDGGSVWFNNSKFADSGIRVNGARFKSPGFSMERITVEGGTEIDFSDPVEWEAAPRVSWSDGASPPYVTPGNWPPKVNNEPPF